MRSRGSFHLRNQCIVANRLKLRIKVSYVGVSVRLKKNNVRLENLYSFIRLRIVETEKKNEKQAQDRRRGMDW